MEKPRINYGYFEPMNTSNGRLSRTKIHAFESISRGEPLCRVYIRDYDERLFVKTNRLQMDYNYPNECMNCSVMLG
ncbi:hypothetical protein LCGC14_0911460 [marine sediment metagenome]|uniref:Uncharacterized protein n=1 Tax=marine sediment metagenome TaxID=412755 RepID=A0A0F9NY68_9ZZZZ